jgi:hypothetical protein
MPKTPRKRPPPFSLWLLPEERAVLEKMADGLPLGTFIRSRIFDGTAFHKPARKGASIVDKEALGRVLAVLGASRLSGNLNQLAKAAHTGVLPVTKETEEALRAACADIAAMRASLLSALGLSAGGTP